jgi:hypothetical protein
MEITAETQRTQSNAEEVDNPCIPLNKGRIRGLLAFAKGNWGGNIKSHLLLVISALSAPLRWEIRNH